MVWDPGEGRNLFEGGDDGGLDSGEGRKPLALQRRFHLPRAHTRYRKLLAVGDEDEEDDEEDDDVLMGKKITEK